MRVYQAGDPLIGEIIKHFEENTGARSEIQPKVREILNRVKSYGDRALYEYTERFDGVDLRARGLRITEGALAAAVSSLSEDQLGNIKRAQSQIEDFHRKTLPKNWNSENPDGALVGERFYPIQSVGLYVPGGNVPLVSSVLMSAVLARLAGNPRIVAVTPPLPDGSVSPGILAALHICGVEEVYTLGGAQAVGALAFGTATIKPVDKIFGPGNAFVLEAKRQVFGAVGVDLLPGPSEVVVVADRGANPKWVAADLMAQAEHGSGKERVMLLAESEDFVDEVGKEILAMNSLRSHADKISNVMKDRFLPIVYSSIDEAAQVLNRFAPEHLELQVDETKLEEFQEKVTTAGAMLLGYHTPTVLGDFVAGPSHTLPTGGAGRFMSGMQVIDFFRRSSTVKYDGDSIRSALPVVETFSELEQLDAHGYSLKVRTEQNS